MACIMLSVYTSEGLKRVYFAVIVRCAEDTLTCSHLSVFRVKCV